MKELVGLLLKASDQQLDVGMKLLIKRWSNPPKAIEIFEVLDKCINGSLASGFTIIMLQMMYQKVCISQNITNEEVMKQAHWRK